MLSTLSLTVCLTERSHCDLTESKWCLGDILAAVNINKHLFPPLPLMYNIMV